MFDWIALIVFIVICYAASAVGAIFTTKNLDVWYDSLRKPSWTPPGGLIGTIWFILYTLMAIAAAIVWSSGDFEQISIPIILFAIQLALNVIWSLLFFAKQDLKGAFVEVVIFWMFILATMIAFFTVNVLAGILFIPYLTWVSIASYLNYTVWRMNPAAPKG
ncbi:MAG: tryptophan-rich sensory protein [Thermoplasmata archaeon]|nr:tryptophan-rich sensory protein [Thermoplasmata archaeon]